jgi:hypothetical protein
MIEALGLVERFSFGWLTQKGLVVLEMMENEAKAALDRRCGRRGAGAVRGRSNAYRAILC